MTRNRTKKGPHRDYLDSLSDYWDGRFRTTLEHVSNLLADEPDHEARFEIYRMWVELLSGEGNYSGLRSLGEHLAQLAEQFDDAVTTYVALQGIIHFELDEIHAARMYCSTLKNAKDCPYAEELKFLINRRMGQSESARKSADKMAGNATDYLHLKQAMGYFYSEQCHDQFNECMDLMSEVYPNSPTPSFFALVDAFQNNELEKCHQYAVDLVNAYPSQSGYWFWAAYSLIKLGHLDRAIPLLNKYVELEGENDPDVLSLIGHCHTKEYLKTKDDKSRERAGYFLRKAEEILAAFGIDAVYANRDFQNIRRASTEKSGRAWVYYLDAKQFASIHFTPEEDARFLECSFSHEVASGDIVFIATKDPVAPEGEDRWKIGSIYVAASDAVGTNPLATSLLELVGRPSVSLPLNINSLGFSEEKTSAGLYELDDIAVETVIKSMEEFYGALPEEGRIFQELARIVSVS